MADLRSGSTGNAHENVAEEINMEVRKINKKVTKPLTPPTDSSSSSRSGSTSVSPRASRKSSYTNPIPQVAPGSSAAVGHNVDNSIPLSIFPIQPDKFVFCFCGLPGRGKTHISRRLGRYLDFFHAMPVRIFNAAEYRRQKYGNINDSEWFDGSNVAAQKIRHEVNLWAVNGSKDFLSEHKSGVAIIDSTNPTHKRRALIVRELLQVGAKVMFIEVINDNQHILTEQYRETVESSPDFEGMEQLQAEVEYRKRIDRYHLYFEPIDEGEYSIVENYWSYMKCDHNRKRFIVNRFGGHLPQRVVHFIMNLRTSTHPFYLSRHGQSIYNALGKIGGDSGLSEHGLNYAKALAEFVDRKITRNSTEEEELPARLWTSTLRRTHETTQFIRQYPLVVKDKGGNAFEWRQMRLRKWHHLDELFAGECDGLTYEEIEKLFPEEFERRSSDKLAYRYPRGESYLDVIARLEPVIIEMERHAEPLLIVAHQGILRIIVAFYTGLSRAEAPYVSVPLNTVLELVPSAFGCKETRHVLYKPEKALPKDGQDEPMAKFPHLLDTNPSSH